MAINAETIDKMAFEVRQKAESLGYNVDLEDLADAKDIGEAYYLGKYEQLLSIQEILDDDGGERMFNMLVVETEKGH